MLELAPCLLLVAMLVAGQGLVASTVVRPVLLILHLHGYGCGGVIALDLRYADENDLWM